MSNPNKASEDLDFYIKNAIETDFPMVEVEEVLDRDLPTSDNLVGLVKLKGGLSYTFFIDLKDPRPTLQAL